MKYLNLLAVVVFGVAGAAQAEVITAPFEAIVSEVVGTPFGIQAQVGVTSVVGSFQFDTATAPSDTGLNSARFNVHIPSGLVLNVQGVSFTYDDYRLTTANDQNIFGAVSDYLRATSFGDSIDMFLIDTDNTMYMRHEDTHMLPTQAQIDLAEVNFGFIVEGRSYIRFQNQPEPVPEPTAGLLLLIGSCVLVPARLM